MVMRSRSAGDARPVLIELNSWCVASMDLSIRLFASARKSSIAAMSPPSGGRDDRADALARGDAADVALGELEDEDRQSVVHAERERRRVHDLEAALDGLEVRERRDEPGCWVLVRVTVIDALHAVLRHEDRLGADLERAKRRGGVGREERVPRAGGEDDDALLLQVSDGATPDVRLGD